METTQTLTFDLTKAVRLQNLVSSGNFDIKPPQSPQSVVSSLKRGPFLTKEMNSYVESVADKRDRSELTQLLLNKSLLRQATSHSHSKALLLQHRDVWRQRAARLSRTAEDLYMQLHGLVGVLLPVRREERQLLCEDSNFDNLYESSCTKRIDSGLSQMMEGHQDFLILYQSVTGQTLNLFKTKNKSGLDLYKNRLAASLLQLGEQESELMREMFWLRPQKSAVIGTTKPSKKEADDNSSVASQDFAICSALSPSKALKIPPNKSLMFSQKRETVDEKRQSFDSGYAESDGANSSTTDETRQTEVAGRKQLEKTCQNCNRKMSVKFDFDQLTATTDSDLWVKFNCTRCNEEEQLQQQEEKEQHFEEDEDSSHSTLSPFLIDDLYVNGKLDSKNPVARQFATILQDITVYYTKKLDMLRIKMEHHSREKPDKAHHDLAMTLMDVYSDHGNKEELWKDMFCQLVGPEATSIHATSILRWMMDENQIKAAMKACLSDLRRESDKVLKSIHRLSIKAKHDKKRLMLLKATAKDQQEHCEYLHNLLNDLRLKRQSKVEEENKLKAQQEKDSMMKQMEAEEKFKRRQRKQWKQIRAYRRNQEEIKAERRFQLHQELKTTVRKRREQALRDFIRVNLRRVMAEQKALERRASLASKELAEREQDARLETLRKQSRRKLGLEIVREVSTARTTTKPTVSFSNKIKTKDEIDEDKDEDPMFKYRKGRPMYKLYTFNEDDIMADPRLVVENVLRDRGLLNKSTYAVNQIMKELKPPTKPRPDAVSQLEFIREDCVQ